MADLLAPTEFAPCISHADFTESEPITLKYEHSSESLYYDAPRPAGEIGVVIHLLEFE